MTTAMIGPEELAQRVRDARKAKKLTQTEAAVLAGVSLRTFQGVENGHRMSRAATVRDVCVALGIDYMTGEAERALGPHMMLDRTDVMLARLLKEKYAEEPPEPSPEDPPELLTFRATKYNEWDAQVRGLRALLGVRLLDNLLDDTRLWDVEL